MSVDESRYNSHSSGKVFHKALGEALQKPKPQERVDLQRIVEFIDNETNFMVVRSQLEPHSTFFDNGDFTIIGSRKGKI